MTTLTPTRLAAMPRVNLLPPEIAAADRLRRLKVMLGALVFAALVLVVLIWLYVGSQVGGAEEELTQAQADGAQLSQDIATYAEVPETTAELAAAKSNLATAMTPEIRWSFYLNDLSLTTPKSTRLSTLTFVNTASVGQLDPVAAETAAVTPMGVPTMGTVAFTGKATGFDAVAAWLQALGKNKSISDPTVTNVTEADSEGSVGKFFDVESNAYLNTEAASNRYLQVETGE